MTNSGDFENQDSKSQQLGTSPPPPTDPLSPNYSVSDACESTNHLISADAPCDPPIRDTTNSPRKSWPFRLLNALSIFASRIFGIASIVILLAITASIPILQFISFGYLIEVSGRLARQRTFRDAMIGLSKASKLGGVIIGCWLTFLPVRILSSVWEEAYLIDPSSSATLISKNCLILLIVLSVCHIFTALICGARFRYFFWPLIAPVSLAIWLARRLTGIKPIRFAIKYTLGILAPNIEKDISNAKPIGDWFLPIILLSRLRTQNIYTTARDDAWSFLVSLNLKYYMLLGLKGFAGSFAWLLIPTLLLVSASYEESGLSILFGILGVLFAIPIFGTLLFLQTHFALDGRLIRFIEVGQVWKNFGRAPIAHLFALTISLVLALPLFLLKIETIPNELLWTLSLVFIIFSWPARLTLGWAYRRGKSAPRSRRWWLRYPMLLASVPIAFAFAIILTLTRYVSWNGALSLFENHVFLLPAPFWL
jgi:hypothetical protein